MIDYPLTLAAIAVSFFLIVLSNILISCLPHIILPKFFKPKRFRGKVSPIYQLREQEYFSYYKVFKYELGWVRLFSLENPLRLLIPLAGFFRYYRYVVVDSCGSFDVKDIERITDFDPKEYYLKREAKVNTEKNKKEAKVLAFKNKLDNMNKEFNQNYCK